MTSVLTSPPRLASVGLPDGVRATSARFSEDMRYRYSLTWSDGEGSALPAVIGLNPSGATEDRGDRTLCKVWRFLPQGFTMLNLFAFRATEPRDLLASEDAIGPENDHVIREVVEAAPFVVVAWGARPGPRALGEMWARRVEVVRGMLQGADVRCWGTCADGSPRHPLYLPGDSALRGWP